ncbi:MAG: serine acetyltransferase [Cryomorphaceae bacterium]|nr:MAG: serine acetyltransferase [Cryomorphaceae bacterium]
MIQSRKDYEYYLLADEIALGVIRPEGISGWLRNLFFPHLIWEFQKALRKLEYLQNVKSGWLARVQKFFVLRRFRRLSYKLGFSIPPNVFGPGLSIAHYGTIIVNDHAQIGANCRIHAGVNIGSRAGFAGEAPKIGDDCYIGPGVKIFGAVTIAHGTAIGANAVVNKSFSEPNNSIAGIPAKSIGVVNTLEFIIPGSILALQPLHDPFWRGKPASEVQHMMKERGLTRT